MLKTVAFSAAVASAAAFTAAPAAVPGLRAGAKTALCANKFAQQAPADAPPADLFNIWRDDYMLTPAEAAAEEAERKKNTLFDGVLPPFTNVGNTGRGDVEGLFRVDDSIFTLADSGLKGQRGLGYARDFSTANPTSAYDTAKFGKVSTRNEDLIDNPLNNKSVEDVAAEVQAKAQTQKTYAIRSFSNFNKWRKGEKNFDEKDGDAGLRGSG